MRFIVLVLFTLSCLSCEQQRSNISESTKPNSETLFVLKDSTQTGVSFTNQVKNNDRFNIFIYRNFYNGGGVGIIDINNDGLKDIFFTGNQVTNRLYLNKGNFKFEDITERAGLAHSNNWSTGVSIVDINQDGFHDIYVSNAGYDEGLSQANELFINNGDNTFTEKAAAYGLADSGYTTHTAFFDYDQDGDLDAYILNNSFIPVNTLNYANKRSLYAEDWDVKDFLKGGGDKLLKNVNGKFKDVSREAGIYGSLIGFGLGVTIGDVNQDNYDDIYVSNDFFERDYLYINNGNGTFKEAIKEQVPHLSLASMGADMADINNDGLPEIFTTEMQPTSDSLIKQKLQFDSYNTYQLKLDRDFYHQYMQNSLQLNQGNNSFSEISWFANVAQSDWSWGALMFDADLDGYKDIFVCNGVYQDVTDADFMDFFANEVVQRMVLTGKKEQIEEVLKKMPSNAQPNKFFKNTGNLSFTSVEDQTGIGQKTFSNGAAYADLDNDGDLDLVLNNINQPSFIYENTSNKSGNHFASFELTYLKPNNDAIGSKIYLYVGNEVLYQQLMPTRGFQSSVDYILNFGLSDQLKIDSLMVVWPNANTTKLYNLPTDSLFKINYSASTTLPYVEAFKSYNTKNVVQFVQGAFDIEVPEEDDYVDFYQEGLIIKMLSKQGPVIEVADLNNDGLGDIILGTPVGLPTYVYYQTQNGKFRETLLANSEKYEDTAIHLFDANGDKKLDIFIGSGGNHLNPDHPNLGNRLYLQQKEEQFAVKLFTEKATNTAVAVSFDYDQDNDLDLFIGNRSIAKNYGLSPKSYLLENDGNGNFTDMTLRRARGLEEIGMVTDAKVANLNNDDHDELIIVGEWMGIKIFEIKNKQLLSISQPLDSLKGWWNTIDIADLNNDALPDLILGNRGENFFFDASHEKPVKLYLQDFDGNGQIEKVITQRIGDKDMPVASKKEITAQVPSLRKQSLKNKEYATKGIKDLFDVRSVENATIKEITTFSSVIAFNQKEFKFKIGKLPVEAQFSSVNAVHCDDFNKDGYPDLLVVGNESNFTPQFSKLDANQGLVLLGSAKEEFTALPYGQSKLNLSGDVKQIKSILIDGVPYLIIAINNKKPEFFKLQ